MCSQPAQYPLIHAIHHVMNTTQVSRVRSNKDRKSFDAPTPGPSAPRRKEDIRNIGKWGIGNSKGGESACGGGIGAMSTSNTTQGLSEPAQLIQTRLHGDRSTRPFKACSHHPCSRSCSRWTRCSAARQTRHGPCASCRRGSGWQPGARRSSP